MARTLDATKQKAILAAAKSIFIADGYDTAKMSDIAAEAGVAPGTLYLYFANKEALASAIGEEFFSKLIVQLVRHVEKIESPDDVVTLVDWALRIASEEERLLAMVKDRKHDPKTKTEHRHRLTSQLAEALSKAISRGTIRNYDDTTILAELLLSLMRRLIMSQTLFEDKDTGALKTGTVTMLQHILFDDVTLAADRLLKRKK